MKKKMLSVCGMARGLAAALSLLITANSSWALPEAPSIERTVTEIEGTGSGGIGSNATMTRPHIPVNHTTSDGRVAIDIKPFEPQSRVEFYLYLPENIDVPFLEANDGPVDIIDDIRVDVPWSNFISEIVDSGYDHPTTGEDLLGVIRHVTIIDKTREFDDGETQDDNPTREEYIDPVSGATLYEDVYKLLVYATVDWEDDQFDVEPAIYRHLKMQMTPITVRVRNPKTVDAYIESVVVDNDPSNPKTASADFIYLPRLFENKFTNDGKLMVARVGIILPPSAPDLTYFAPDNDNPLAAPVATNFMDTVYAFSSSGTLDGISGDPRDGFDNVIPIAYAPYDPRINGEYLNDGNPATEGEFYPFAAFPFRDGSGTIIPKDLDFGGSYPWIDSDGRTLSMSTTRGRLANGTSDPSDDLYTNTLIPGVTTGNYNEDGGPFMNQSVVGLWTQGKLVTMDNTLNNIDFGMRKNPEFHRILTDFYAAAPGGSGHLAQTDIRVGSGRDNNNVQMFGGAGNTTFFDTIENKFNFNDNLKPVMPRDVVWWVSNGKSTAQFAFDDYLNKNSFIVSKMNGALEFDSGQNANSRFYYYDGRDNNGNTSIRVANDGTAVSQTVADEVAQNIDANTPIVARWNIPANGLVEGANVRLEPIAHGGIEGKGLWLDADASITYDIPAQPTGSSVVGSSWYVGIFVDSRFADDTNERRLITFPDGSSIRLWGREEVRYYNTSNALEHSITLPGDGTALAWNRNEWCHLAFQIYAGGQTVEFYHNGFLADTTPNLLSESMFQMDVGDLIVGATSGSSNGITGWVDDFKVFAEIFGPEVSANLARGTLVGFDAVTGVNDDMVARAGLYGIAGAENIRHMLYHSGQASHEFQYYAVHHDYTTHDGAHLGNLPDGTTSIREDIVFPEAPLFHNVHRPDSIDMTDVGGVNVVNSYASNQFCLSCHDDSNPADVLKLRALELDNTVLARVDERRQPIQPLARVFGHIPTNWIGTHAELDAGSSGILIDQYVLGPQGASSRTAHTLSLLDDSGEVIESVITDDFIPYDASFKIRANLDAAQGSVRFTVTNTATSVSTDTEVHEAPYVIDVPAAGNYDIQAEPFTVFATGEFPGVPYSALNVTLEAAPIGSTIALRIADATSDGYVTLNSGQNDRMEATASSPSTTTEHFVVEFVATGIVALRSVSTGLYAEVDTNDTQKRMYATASSWSGVPEAQFEWTKLDENTIQLTNQWNSANVHFAGNLNVLRANLTGTGPGYEWDWEEIVP